MKALLRSSVVALMLLGGYAAIATNLGTSQAGPFPRPPQCPMPPAAAR
jgi:hypothetical protein